MKHLHFIALMFLVLVLACNRPVETRHGTSLPSAVSPQLQAVDSLMWTRPDSALAVLLPWFDTSCRDGVRTVSTAYDRHYANLLLSELLYKNDYGQNNREKLLKAVDYFDSLMIATDTRGVSLHRAARRDTSKYEVFDGVNVSATDAQTLAFLDARAHYINGVGCYERDSVVEACKEYLKALEMMEDHFEEKELVGHRARFMIYVYNRLGDLFSDQFMMDAAIYCYKHSCSISRISPASTNSVSSALYRIGNQFDVKNESDSANYYYLAAISNISDTLNLLYRDIVSSQSLLYYQLTHKPEPVLRRLKQMTAPTVDFGEKLTRYLSIGYIYFEECQYDSAQLYLQAVFENKADAISKIQAAEFLRILYDSLGEKEKSDYYMRSLAMHKPMEHDSEAKVSVLGELFKNHLEKRQKQQLEKDKLAERQHAIKRTLTVLVPVFLCVLFVFVLFVKNKHKKNIKAKENEAERKMHEQSRQHEELVRRIQTDAKKTLEEAEKRHTEAIEAERQAHHIEKSAMSGRLKKSNQELRELRNQVKLREDKHPKTGRATSFTEEPVCKLIMARVKDGKFKSKVDYNSYKEYALDKEQLRDLRMAVDYHFNQLTTRLKKAHPSLTKIDLDYCCLYLLGLADADVAALMQRAYNTVSERGNRIRKIFGNENQISATLWDIAEYKYMFDRQDIN